MKLLYRAFFWILPGLLTGISLFSGKIRHFLAGRRSIFSDLEKFRKSNHGRLLWVHVASLGEYEQARPVIARWKEVHSDYLVAVSFFSPSGYDHVTKKQQPNVDWITYLPLDRKDWARKFVSELNPQVALFVKYDLWAEYIWALKSAHIPTFLIAAAFRKEQIYFQFYGHFFKNILKQLTWVYTQNQASKALLEVHEIAQVSVAGDTRFDRVAATAAAPKELPEIQKWIGDRKVVVIGSAWEEDMNLLIPLINAHPEYCWIIAPHDLSPEPMLSWASKIQSASAFHSQWDSSSTASVLFIDNIGMLSSLYQFANVAYVGGAFGKGLHNILEPMGFGIPVIFGQVKKQGKFPEAAQSVAEGCGFSVSTYEDLDCVFSKLQQNEFYHKAADSAQKWVKSNLGVADKIVASFQEKLQIQ